MLHGPRSLLTFKQWSCDAMRAESSSCELSPPAAPQTTTTTTPPPTLTRRGRHRGLSLWLSVSRSRQKNPHAYLSMHISLFRTRSHTSFLLDAGESVWARSARRACGVQGTYLPVEWRQLRHKAWGAHAHPLQPLWPTPQMCAPPMLTASSLSPLRGPTTLTCTTHLNY